MKAPLLILTAVLVLINILSSCGERKTGRVATWWSYPEKVWVSPLGEPSTMGGAPTN